LNYYISHGEVKLVVPGNEEDDNEPMMCSKCNVVFSTESDYLKHYNEMHAIAEGR
jgi:uncharacterized C2H2 Zn-finger protein